MRSARSAQPPIYILQLNTSQIPSKPALSFYTNGIRPRLIALEKAHGWEISRYTLINGTPVNCILSHQFIAFQRLWRHYSSFRRRVKSLRFLRDREVSGFKLSWSPPTKGCLYALAVAVARSGSERWTT